MVDQTAPQVNLIVVKEVRASFIQFIPALGLLRSRKPPAIPCPFLLSDVDFRKQYPKAQTSARTQPPERYGKLFWCRYVPNPAPPLLWRGLVPIEYDLQPLVHSLVLGNCNVVVRAYLYPWGIGLIVDVKQMDTQPLDHIVNQLRDIRDRAKIKWKFDKLSGNASPAGLTAALIDRLRPDIYGAQVEEEDFGQQFTIVTVIDADNVEPKKPIVDGDSIHLALEGLVGWNRDWADIPPQPNALVAFRIASRPGKVGHILYGQSRARAVWFPAAFRSKADYPPRLSCYHKNLSVATMHTEALCALAQDAAGNLRAGKLLDTFSATYRSCAQLAAGILGRLQGNKIDDPNAKKVPIYRSGSVRAHILTYKDDVNELRSKIPTINTPLDT
jgi:hypothetical protein